MATVSVINEPYEYSPVNGELWYRVDSASSSVTDFKYVFKVTELNPTTSSVITDRGTYYIPPRPDSYGLFSPDKILRASTSYDLQPSIIGFQSATNSIVKYNLGYGFQYNPSLTWLDTFFTPNLGLTFSTPHGLQVGDIILLDKANKTINPQYDGITTVSTVPGPTSIIVNKGFGDSSTLEGGDITLLTRLSATSSDRFAYNGTRQYLERTVDFTDYKSSNTGRILNGYYGNYKEILPLQDETISLLIGTSSSPTTRAFISTYNIGNNLVATYSIGNTSSSAFYRRIDFGSGTKNLALAGVTFSGVKYYTVQFGDTVPYVNSNYMIAKYVINSDCSVYTNFRIMFLNKNGAFNYFNFKMDSKKVINTTTKNYNRTLDWDYSVGQRGETVLSQDVQENWTINSDWISEFDSYWLEDLFKSTEVYHISNSGDILPIIVSDKSYEIKTYNREQIFNITLNFSYAYDIRVQNN